MRKILEETILENVEAVVALLQQSGIKSEVTASEGDGGFETYIVLVQEAEAERASQIVEEFEETSKEESVCPQCGSTNGTADAIENENSFISTVFLFVCKNCGASTVVGHHQLASGCTRR